MTRYEIKFTATHEAFGRIAIVYPTDLSTVQALWAALPPDLRLALAKTAPRVLGPWKPGVVALLVRCVAGSNGPCVASVHRERRQTFKASVGGGIGDYPTSEEAQSACDAALCAQGYVLDDGGAL